MCPLLKADAAIKFIMGSLDNENSEIATALQMALKLCISESHTNLSQLVRCLRSGTEVDSEYFPGSVKILWCKLSFT
jgi:hypothetical protein